MLLGGESGLAHFTLLDVLDGRQPLPRLPELPDAITTVWAAWERRDLRDAAGGLADRPKRVGLNGGS